MEYIKSRRSVRTYTGEPLRSTDQALIRAYLNDAHNLRGISGHTVTIQLVEMSEGVSGKIGTYGIIKDAPAFLIVMCENTQEGLMDCGYVFEKMVLFLHKHHLGTCWMGGTFNRKSLGKMAIDLPENQFIPIISPVGYAAAKPHFAGAFIRRQAKSDTRLDFNELFYYKNFDTAITDQAMMHCLEYVQVAPSASNKQPWRIIMNEDGSADFYIKRTANYGGKALGYDIQILDIGIAISHYEMASQKKHYFSKQGAEIQSNPDMQYVISVK